MAAPLLPKQERDLLTSLSREALWFRVQELVAAGWSYQSIANAFEPVKTRSTIRSWVVKKVKLQESLGAVPRPPIKAPRLRRIRPKSPGIPHDEQLRIARLSPLARRYRARTSPAAASYNANHELSQIAKDLYLKGVTVSELARVSGVTYRAMKRRVDRALTV